MKTGAAEARVHTSATIENSGDLWAAKRGLISDSEVRRIEIQDALVDSGATLISAPTRIINQLGLENTGPRRVMGCTGRSEANMYSPVRLTIQGRSCTMDVMEVPDGFPVVIGRLPLLHLDFVIDSRTRELVGNPAHGGKQVYELY
jgi:predicted aspartyl protease